jgi:hypothetical protein
MFERAKELLASGQVARVLGWEKGEFWYDLTPAFFETSESLDNFVYSGFSGANLSKYLIGVREQEGKTLVFLKPCDTLSFNQLLTEHRVDREKVYVIGAGCKGMLDINKMKAQGIRREEDVTDRQAVLLLKGDHLLEDVCLLLLQAEDTFLDLLDLAGKLRLSRPQVLELVHLIGISRKRDHAHHQRQKHQHRQGHGDQGVCFFPFHKLLLRKIPERCQTFR